MIGDRDCFDVARRDREGEVGEAVGRGVVQVGLHCRRQQPGPDAVHARLQDGEEGERLGREDN